MNNDGEHRGATYRIAKLPSVIVEFLLICASFLGFHPCAGLSSLPHVVLLVSERRREEEARESVDECVCAFVRVWCERKKHVGLLTFMTKTGESFFLFRATRHDIGNYC